jgi:hypothetical protein
VTADHPSIDTLADYCAELLSGPAAETVRQHLLGCASCEADADAIRRVPAHLAAAGRSPLTMPDFVERRIDDALRSEDAARASNAVTAVTGITRKEPRLTPSQGRWTMLAAAAAVIVAGTVGVVRELGGGSTGTAPSASTAAHGTLPSAPPIRSVPARQGRGIPTEADKAVGPLTPQNLSSYAAQLSRTLSGKPETRDTPSRTGCAVPSMSASDVVRTGWWLGAPAVVVVHRSIRRVTVLDCRTASTVLYSAGY